MIYYLLSFLMHNFRKLDIWIRSIDYSIEIYRITSTFPKHELFGLVSQLRRASISIPSNISEGCGKNSDPDLARFCYMSMGSSNECYTLLLLSNKLKYIDDLTFKRLEKELTEIQKMISTFIKTLI